jgi:FemAB-related protein (PEP-CTERM system-associated)
MTDTSARNLIVRPYQATDAAAWDAFVLSQPQGTVFHLLKWSAAVEATYGHRPCHLVAWSGDHMVGVLPLFVVKSIFVGKVLVSVPYATYGGIVAESPEAAQALLEAAQELCRLENVNYLELRHREERPLDLPVIDRYDTFRKELPATAEEILPSFPRKTRAAARKGLDMLGEDAATTGPELLDTIYDLYAVTLRRLGSPNYSRRLFHELQRAYGDDCVCMLVRDAGKPMAGVISFAFRDELVPYFSGSLDEGMLKNVNNVMYLRLMEFAANKGVKWFDFNRTRRDNHGPHAFKRYHGFEPAPLHYQIYLNKSGKAPNLSPSNKKFALAGKVWQRLPLGVTQRAGSVISKWIP